MLTSGPSLWMDPLAANHERSLAPGQHKQHRPVVPRLHAHARAGQAKILPKFVTPNASHLLPSPFTFFSSWLKRERKKKRKWYNITHESQKEKERPWLWKGNFTVFFLLLFILSFFAKVLWRALPSYLVARRGAWHTKVEGWFVIWSYQELESMHMGPPR